MGKRKSSMLSSINADEEILESVYNSRKVSNDVVFSKKQYGEILLKRVNLKAKNEKQREFIETIENNEITICIGDSGVGKSYLSIAKALDLLKNGRYEKIFIITPIIDSNEGESIGYLKGSLTEKLDPYLYSIYYIVDKIIGEDVRKKLVENKIIEPLCISYLRGMNLDNCVVVIDESQNITIKGMLTLLTRIGYNCKYILSGDINQIDRFKKTNESGLKFIYENLKGLSGIGFIEFSKSDIVRNPIIGDIIDRFVEHIPDRN